MSQVTTELIQAPMSGVYFAAKEMDVEVMEEFEGSAGMFFKTFALNDKRNKNGWKAVWQGIVKNLESFKDRPGIEFTKCDSNGCDLDHTEAETKEMSLQVQEPYRKTTIVGTQLDHNNHTSYFIHETTDREFFEKVKNGEIKYVSPSIWPRTGGYEIVGEMENGTPMIDVWEWDGLHDAFVNRPAFGDDAKITAVCEGSHCPVKLLSAKEVTAYAAADKIQECVTRKIKEYGSAPDDQKLAIFYSECRKTLEAIVDPGDIGHLQQIPLLVNHNKKKRFVSVSAKAYSAVSKLLEDGSGADEKTVFEIIRQEQENSSFNSCTCSSNQNMSPDEEKEMKSKLQAMEKENEDLKSKLQAQDDDKEKQHQARKARYVAVLQAQDNDDDREKTAAAIRAACDEEEMKAMDEAEKEVKTAKKGSEDNDKDKENSAKIATLEAKLAQPIIDKMAKARALKGASDDEIERFKKSYEGASLSAVESDYAKEQIFIEESLNAVDNSPETGKHFEMSDSGQGALSGKSLEETFSEVTTY